MIRFEGLSKSYGDFQAVRSIDLEVSAGEVFGFVGPNGAGKTTTMRMMVGLLRPTAGRVLVGGKDIQVDSVAVKAMMGYIPDRPFIYEKLTGEEFLSFIAGLYRISPELAQTRLRNLLDEFGLGQWGGHLVESYSHGMKQRLVMCSALLHEPSLLVVDEPMVGLDPAGARLIKDIFRRICHTEERTVFLSTHSLEVAEELCDRIGMIYKGEIIALGTMDELRARAGEKGDGGLEDIFFHLAEEAESGEPSGTGWA